MRQSSTLRRIVFRADMKRKIHRHERRCVILIEDYRHSVRQAVARVRQSPDLLLGLCRGSAAGDEHAGDSQYSTYRGLRRATHDGGMAEGQRTAIFPCTLRESEAQRYMARPEW